MKGLGLVFMCFTTVLSAQFSFNAVGELPVALSESSGLLFFEDRLLTLNDSGGRAELYEIDVETLEITRTVAVLGVQNTDWEALSQDTDHIYIGDFGNNVGTRRDLAIYKIAKADYLDADAVTPEIIMFRYGDQESFENEGNSDWDAEAFVVLDSNILVFTKQWQSGGTVAYSLPKTAGEHTAQVVDSLGNVGLVTDAHYNPLNRTTVLLGYSTFLSPFVILAQNTDAAAPFGTQQQRLELGLVPLQAEGITLGGEGHYYVSSEFFSRTAPNITSAARVFLFSLDGEGEPNPGPEPPLPPGPGPEPEPGPPNDNELPELGDNANERLIVYRDRNQGKLRYIVNSDKPIFGQRVFDVTGKMVWESKGPEFSRIGEWPPFGSTSIYYFTVYFNDGVVSTPFLAY
ncbi:hypothetical protein [Maribacter sp. 2307ULW6-5]|uniref:hypothetical protein n=1 Tax=Maribacter sp. 2307ULW6-5 TaxID=3386275 RepID=UPI0039BD4287